MSSDGSPPDADTILQRSRIKYGDFAEIFRQGLRGVVYGFGLFFVAIISGATDVIASFFGVSADGVRITFLALYNSFAELILAGAARTADGFLLPAPFGFVEGIAWVLVALAMIRLGASFLETDIFPLPGFDVIPFFGAGDEGDED